MPDRKVPVPPGLQPRQPLVYEPWQPNGITQMFQNWEAFNTASRNPNSQLYSSLRSIPGMNNALPAPVNVDMNVLKSTTGDYAENKGNTAAKPTYDNASYDYAAKADANAKFNQGTLNTVAVGGNILGSAASAIGNTGRGSVGMGALGGVLKGASAGAMLGPIGAGVGAVIGGLIGLGTSAARKQKYDEAKEAQADDKIKAATVYGGDIGEYELGGNVEGQPNELTPIQAEKGEYIVTPDGSIFKTKATKTHKQMEDDEITDILPGGSLVVSNSKKERIDKKLADTISLGFDVIQYDEYGQSSPVKERTLGELFNKKKMTPAEIIEVVKNKFPVSDLDDPFTRKSNKANLQARMPYIKAVIDATNQ